jgi:DNA replication and repair protein RecF
MWINRLAVQNLRNLTRLSLEPVAGANLIIGPNASGKTSLLESITLLSTTRSFRTHHSQELIQRGTDSFAVFAQITHRDGRHHQLGLERSKDQTRMKLDGEIVKQTSAFARQLPIQVVHPAGIQLLDQGPKFRRQFLDWGVFHVKPDYLKQWRQYARILKQRNAALRQHDLRTLPQWDSQLSELAGVIHTARHEYVTHLESRVLPEYFQLLLQLDGLQVDYRPGWDSVHSLQERLAACRQKDIQMGHTTLGPHRADLVFRYGGQAVEKVFSRGQLKLFTCALHLAQARVFRDYRDQACIFLVDDLSSELDEQARGRLMAQLAELESQVFVTGIDASMVPLAGWTQQRVFHVEHGKIKDVV